MRHSSCILALAVIAVTLCAVPTTARAAGAGTPERRDGALVIGKVSDNPKKHYDYLKPMVEYAVSKMGDLGITRAEVLMAPSNEVMIEYLRSGRVDWVTETPFSAVVFRNEAGAELLLRKWKKGVPRYGTVFAVRTDSGITSLGELTGHTIAFEDEGSSSSFFVPAAELIAAGLRLVQLESPRDEVPPDAVGYVFSHEEINSSIWLYRGIVDAAAFNDIDWEKEDHVPASCREDLRIIHATPPIDRAIELVRADLDPAIRDRLRDILLHAHEDPDATDALWSYQQTARFDELGTESVTGLESIEESLRIVLEELGR